MTRLKKSKNGFARGAVKNRIINMSDSKELRPKVGIGVVVFKNGKVLVGQRKSAHGTGEYAWPGGHLEHLESFEACARREVKEETDLEIQNIRFLRLANVTTYAPKHYVDIALIADWKSGEAKVMEPDKLESWAWFDLGNLPSPLFEFCKSAVDAIKTGKNYYDCA